MSRLRNFAHPKISSAGSCAGIRINWMFCSIKNNTNTLIKNRNSYEYSDGIEKSDSQYKRG